MFRRIAATAAAMAAVVAVPAAFAGTSELQQADMVVPYACSVSPVSATLVAAGTNASASGPNTYSNNSATVISLSPVTFSGPLGVNNAAYSGGITLRNPALTTIVGNGSKSVGASSGVQPALQNETGSTLFSFNTSESAFRAGAHSMSATLTCAQAEGI